MPGHRDRLLALAVAGAAVLAAPARPAAADDQARMNFLEENDSLYFHSDKHYTQGLRISYLAPSLGATSWWTPEYDFLAQHTPIFARPAVDRRAAFFFGQSIFTPKNLGELPPDPHDRPYAAWLYGGMSLLQRDAGDTLENLELELGVTGPPALGEEVQNDWHQFVIGISGARGWSYQLRTEPGLVLSYDRHWRFPVAGGAAFGADVVPEAGVTAGNIFDYGEIGVIARIGSDLKTDYGPVRVRPALSGTDYFDGTAAASGLGGYFYIGVQGRAVGRNIFLDGNTFEASPSVPRKVLVGDVEAGFAFLWSQRVRLDFSVTERSEEFQGQRTPDEIGTAALSFPL